MEEVLTTGYRKVAGATALLILMLAPVRMAAADSNEWPRDVAITQGAIRIYAPQVESLEGDTLKSRAAIAFTPVGDSAGPVFGALWLTAKVTTDPDSRTVGFPRLAVTRIRLPNVSDSESSAMASEVENRISEWRHTMSLDRLSAELAGVARERQAAAAIQVDPPKILVSRTPAVLMLIDGEPERRAIEGTPLEEVVNTPFAVLFDTRSRTYFTSNGDVWYESREVEGPWMSGIQPPPEVVAAVADARREADSLVRGAGAADPESSPRTRQPISGRAPTILLSTVPAELLSFDGEPEWAPITGTALLAATNTASDVFIEIATQHFFVLLSGRWFTSPSLDGPWSFVAADRLPADFARIPPGTEQERVLPSVAGTSQAEEALLDARVPQTAVIERGAAHLTVIYDGEPRFDRIPGTNVAYAVNTASQVLEIHGRYFAVDQGVWFSAASPTGPWIVSDERPEEVDAIPPSSPVYNTRYVYVYDSTPEVVYVGYLPGYVGCYPWGPTVLWGTGYRYRPWRGRYYFPRPFTWGFGVHYRPWWGWAFDRTPCADFLWFGSSWGPHRHGHGSHRPGWYGPAGPPPVYRPPQVTRPPVYTPRPIPPVGPHTHEGLGPHPTVVRQNLYRQPENVGRISPVVAMPSRTPAISPSPTAAPTRPTSNPRPTRTGPSESPALGQPYERSNHRPSDRPIDRPHQKGDAGPPAPRVPSDSPRRHSSPERISPDARTPNVDRPDRMPRQTPDDRGEPRRRPDRPVGDREPRDAQDRSRWTPAANGRGPIATPSPGAREHESASPDRTRAPTRTPTYERGGATPPSTWRPPSHEPIPSRPDSPNPPRPQPPSPARAPAPSPWSARPPSRESSMFPSPERSPAASPPSGMVSSSTPANRRHATPTRSP